MPGWNGMMAPKGTPPAVVAKLSAYRALLPQAASRSKPRHADQPYRLLNDLMRARLQATLDDAPEGYSTPREFADDVDLILHSLEQNRGVHAGWFAVRRLAWRVRSFGFTWRGWTCARNPACTRARSRLR